MEEELLRLLHQWSASEEDQLEDMLNPDLPLFPHSKEREMRVLSRLISEESSEVDRSFSDFRNEGADRECFFVYRSFFEFIESRYDAGKPLNLISLTESIPPDLLKNIGGQHGLVKILQEMPSHANFTQYVKDLMVLKAKRKSIEFAKKVISCAEDLDTTASELFECLESSPSTDLSGASTNASTGKEAFTEWLDHWEQKKIHGNIDLIESGIPGLDDLRGGIDFPGLTVVGAYPSSGKSAFAIQVVSHLLQEGKRVVFFTLEMPTKKLLDRFLIHLCGFENPKTITDPKERPPTKEDLRTIQEKSKILCSENLIIDWTAGIKDIELAARAKVWNRKKKVDLIVVDFIQKMKSEGSNVEQVFTGAISTLQNLMKELDVSILVLSQLNKEGEAKYAASVDENADLFIKIMREKGEEEVEDLFISKDRHYGFTGKTLGMGFDKLKQVFEIRNPFS